MTDAWTSIAKGGYVTCTVHFIDDDTWKLCSMVLGLYEKTVGNSYLDKEFVWAAIYNEAIWIATIDAELQQQQNEDEELQLEI